MSSSITISLALLLAALLVLGSNAPSCAAENTSAAQNITFVPRDIADVLRFGRGCAVSTPALLPANEQWITRDSKEINCAKGITLLNRGAWHNAIIEFTNAIKSNPNNMVAYAYRAAATQLQTEYENTDLLKPPASAIFPAGHRRKGQTDMANLRAGRTRFDQTYSDARADYDRVLAAHPHTAYIHRNLANLYEWHHDLQLARSEFETALQLAPHDVLCLYSCALFNSHNDAPDRALAQCSAAIKLNPDCSFLYCVRGNCDQRCAKFKQAISDFSKALQQEPTNLLAYVFRGDSYMITGKPAQAVQDYTKAIALEPKMFNAWHNRGNCNLELQHFTQALNDYTHAVQLAPELAYPYSSKGEVYRALRKYKEALVEYTRAISREPNCPMYYVGRASTYNALGAKTNALADVNKAIALKTTDANAYELRAKLEAESGQFGESALDLDQMHRLRAAQGGQAQVNLKSKSGASAILIPPEQAKSDALVASTMKRGRIPTAKDIAAAIEGYTKVIDLKRASPDNYYNRAILYMCCNKYAQALSDLGTFGNRTRAGRALALSRLFAIVCTQAMHQPQETAQLTKQFNQTEMNDSFLKQLGKYADHRLDSKVLLSDARTPNDQSLARYFLGAEALSSGRIDEARNFFAWVRDHTDLEKDEYMLSLAQLNRLDSGTKTSRAK